MSIRSVSKSHSVFNPADHLKMASDVDGCPDMDELPGMVAETVNRRVSSSTSTASTSSSSSSCYHKHVPSQTPEKRSFIHPCKVVSQTGLVKQNRRLLPETKNELHIVDGQDRYFIGIIDFFTRYTLKKKLENAYKSVIYKRLSFSTVHPKVFRRRFIKYWEDHTE